MLSSVRKRHQLCGPPAKASQSQSRGNRAPAIPLLLQSLLENDCKLFRGPAPGEIAKLAEHFFLVVHFLRENLKLACAHSLPDRFKEFCPVFAAVAASARQLSLTPLAPSETPLPPSLLVLSIHPSRRTSTPEHHLRGTALFPETP